MGISLKIGYKYKMSDSAEYIEFVDSAVYSIKYNINNKKHYIWFFLLLLLVY